MAKVSKRLKAAAEKMAAPASAQDAAAAALVTQAPAAAAAVKSGGAAAPVSLADAAAKVVGGSGVKFDESVDVAIRLGIDPKKSDQNVRGSAVLPAGTGKTTRVAVVAAGEKDREEAKAAGADWVGFEDVINAIGDGQIAFDVLIATPESMRQLAAVAKILGPRGLMPNPKNDTVVKAVGDAVIKAKGGQVRFRNDKAGIIHAPVGKASFSAEQLVSNVEQLISALKKAKPASSKGVYLRSLSLSSTMGRSARADIVPYR